MTEIRKINAEDTYELRHRILRPHQSIEQCQYPGDSGPSTAHYGVFNAGEVIGILSIYKTQNKEISITENWQLRAMAIKESMRGKGYGFTLLSAAELYVSSQGGKCVWANSRLNAVGFYEKSGYSTIGEEFSIPDIGPHYLVYKKVV